MTDAELEKLEALLAKATPQPWKADKNLGCKSIKGDKRGQSKQGQHTELAYTVGLSDEAADAANARLIATTVNALPSLISTIRSLREENAARDRVVEAARAALERQCKNVDRWLETGEPASPEESRSIYEQMRAALAALEEVKP